MPVGYWGVPELYLELTETIMTKHAYTITVPDVFDRKLTLRLVTK